MQYNAKDYFYYFLLEHSDKFRNSMFMADILIDFLGNFSLSKFSLKVVDDESRGYEDRFIVSKSFKLENQNMGVGTFCMEKQYGNFSFDGVFDDGNIINIYVNNDIASAGKFGLQFTIVNDNEMLFYTSEMYNGYDGNYYPAYAYYDAEVIRSLKDTGKNLKDIVRMKPEALVKLGICPDVFSFTSSDELGFKDQKEFARRLLRDLSYKDIKERISNIDTNNDKTNKHLKYSSRPSFHTAISNFF